MRRLSLVLMVLCLGVLSASAQQQPLPFPTDPDAIPPIGAAPSTALAFPSDEIAPYETPPIVPDFSTLPRFTLLVNSPADGEDVTIDGVCLAASGFCTLRAAIAEANSITSSTILLPLNSYTLTLGQLPTITGSVYIVGQPVNTNQLEPFPVISGNNTSRIFEIASSGFLGVQGVTLIDGFANDGNGGCVLVQGGGLLSMEYSSLRSCSADLTGGAVSLGNFASANFKNVSFMDNGALGVSAVGSPFDGSGASLTLTNVSVTGGVSSNGTAAVNITNGWLTMNNVTISTNQASTSASGLAVHPRNASAVNLSHVTITNNTGTQVAAGGGLLRYGGDFGLNLVNSVIAGNTYVGDPTRDDCIDTSGMNQTFVSAQHSVVGVLGGCTTFISTQFTSGVSVPLLPLAGYLTRNRTFTHAITPDSILFDNALRQLCPFTDARGMYRFGARCDIGAYELDVRDVLRNGDFERCTTFAPWVKGGNYGGDRIFSDVNNAYSGLCGYRFAGRAAKPTTPGTLTQTVTSFPGEYLVSGNLVTVSAFIKSAPTTNARLRLTVAYSDGTPSQSSVLRVPANTPIYQRITRSVTLASPNVSSVTLAVVDNSTSGVWYIDNVRVFFSRTTMP